MITSCGFCHLSRSGSSNTFAQCSAPLNLWFAWSGDCAMADAPSATVVASARENNLQNMSAPSLCCRSATRQLSGVSLPLVRGEIFDLRQQCQIAAWYIARSRMNSLAKIFAVGSLLCVSAAAFAAQRDADTYPTRPIRLMVPQNPGASVDNISRILAARMGEELGQQIVADNRPGAGGTLAAEVVAHAVPDGQTLFAVATGTAVISPQTFKKLAYDPIKDFEYISLFAITQNVLVVHPSLPVKSVKELLAYAKANPGKLNMANAGSASQSHLACVLFTHMAAIDVVHVPYKGGGASVTALIGNESQVTITPAPAVLS